jgi:type VI secretion system protein ImpH
MAASNWGTSRRIDESLLSSASEFDFFQAVKLLTQMYGEQHPESVPAQAEAVRFCANNSLAFPASAIARVDENPGGPPRMTVTFLGLTGSEGVLPAAYTELAIDRECFGDNSFADFLDIFNHRLIGFFYRAWEKYHFVIEYEQVLRNGSGTDAFTSYLFDLIGMGTPRLQGRLSVADKSLLRYAGLLSQRPHSAEALRSLLHDYFELPVSVEQLLGRWQPLDPDELCYLSSGESSSQLGGGAVAGDAVWTRQALIRIVFGPLSARQFRGFLPDGKCFAEAAALVRWFVGGALDFEIQPTLQGNEVPPCQLGDEASSGPRLGWSAWVRTESFATAATDAIFREEELVRLEA